MSNPIVNRLGLNLFWHHFWYSDTRYALYVYQDKLIKLLIETYITYGSNFQTNIFWNSYWFKTTLYSQTNHHRKYYRWASIVNKVFHTSTDYRFRLTGEQLIRARFTLLRFNTWLVINFFWFQPNKAHKRNLGRSNLQESLAAIPHKMVRLKKLIPLRSVLHYTFVATKTYPLRYIF